MKRYGEREGEKEECYERRFFRSWLYVCLGECVCARSCLCILTSSCNYDRGVGGEVKTGRRRVTQHLDEEGGVEEKNYKARKWVSVLLLRDNMKKVVHAATSGERQKERNKLQQDLHDYLWACVYVFYACTSWSRTVGHVSKCIKTNRMVDEHKRRPTICVSCPAAGSSDLFPGLDVLMLWSGNFNARSRL